MRRNWCPKLRGRSSPREDVATHYWEFRTFQWGKDEKGKKKMERQRNWSQKPQILVLAAQLLLCVNWPHSDKRSSSLMSALHTLFHLAQSCEAGRATVPILYRRKLRHRWVQASAHISVASKCENKMNHFPSQFLGIKCEEVKLYLIKIFLKCYWGVFYRYLDTYLENTYLHREAIIHSSEELRFYRTHLECLWCLGSCSYVIYQSLEITN